MASLSPSPSATARVEPLAERADELVGDAGRATRPSGPSGPRSMPASPPTEARAGLDGGDQLGRDGVGVAAGLLALPTARARRGRGPARWRRSASSTSFCSSASTRLSLRAAATISGTSAASRAGTASPRRLVGSVGVVGVGPPRPPRLRLGRERASARRRANRASTSVAVTSSSSISVSVDLGNASISRVVGLADRRPRSPSRPRCARRCRRRTTGRRGWPPGP